MSIEDSLQTREERLSQLSQTSGIQLPHHYLNDQINTEIDIKNEIKYTTPIKNNNKSIQRPRLSLTKKQKLMDIMINDMDIDNDSILSFNTNYTNNSNETITSYNTNNTNNININLINEINKKIFNQKYKINLIKNEIKYYQYIISNINNIIKNYNNNENKISCALVEKLNFLL